MIAEFFKRNSLILVFSLITLAMIVLLLIQIDKQYYQNEKKSVILNNIDAYVGGDTDELGRAALEDLKMPTAAHQKVLESQINQMLDNKQIVWRIQIRQTPPEDRSKKDAAAAAHETTLIDVVRPEKLETSNNFSNSLFLRNFSGLMTVNINDEITTTRYGRLALYYTTPLGSAEIEELTTLYRWYCAFFVMIAVLLAYVVARRLLYPISNVTSVIERSTPSRTVFIEQPHSRLESLYNRMALDAVMARLQGQMRDEVARHPQMTGWEVLQCVCRAFSEQLEPALLGCIEMIAEGPGRIRATEQCLFLTRGEASMAPAELRERIDPMMPRDGRTEAAFSLPDFDPPLEGALELIPDPERNGTRYLFVLGIDARLPESATLALRPMLDRLTDLVETGLQTLSLRNQILVQERGRANISLSRNLGHDLTNIIATSKLELMALERLLGGGRAPEDERRREILVESLRGLLSSVRFMQETVNLYRSYAFLQHPMLETHDGNVLVNETLDLFSMSVSAKVELRRELAEGAPRCVVDPRLIKLALFNMFANALESIRKAGSADRAVYGWIRVVTGRGLEGGLRIAIEDSGTGILNEAGERAENHEIEKIFELGYTSRRAGDHQGEGLGLNWVRTIVQDLHGGMITAENIDHGGARFVLSFPAIGK